MSEEQSLDTQEVQEPLDTREFISRELDKLDAAESVKEPAGDRDEKGRFAAKSQPEAPVAEEKPESEPEVKSEPEEKPEEPKRNPFAAWKKDAQAALTALPPETQQYIVEREQQFHKGIQQYKEDAIKGRTLSNALAPHMEYLNQLQVQPEQAISKLLETERVLRTSEPQAKIQAFMKLAHDYGIDVNNLTNAKFDPYSYQLEQKLAQQQSMLEKLSQSRQMAEEAQLGQTIEQFAQSHEYFEDVRETMADLLDKGLASDLDVIISPVSMDL